MGLHGRHHAQPRTSTRSPQEHVVDRSPVSLDGRRNALDVLDRAAWSIGPETRSDASLRHRRFRPSGDRWLGWSTVDEKEPRGVGGLDSISWRDLLGPWRRHGECGARRGRQSKKHYEAEPGRDEPSEARPTSMKPGSCATTRRPVRTIALRGLPGMRASQGLMARTIGTERCRAVGALGRLAPDTRGRGPARAGRDVSAHEQEGQSVGQVPWGSGCRPARPISAFITSARPEPT